MTEKVSKYRGQNGPVLGHSLNTQHSATRHIPTLPILEWSGNPIPNAIKCFWTLFTQKLPNFSENF